MVFSSDVVVSGPFVLAVYRELPPIPCFNHRMHQYKNSDYKILSIILCSRQDSDLPGRTIIGLPNLDKQKTAEVAAVEVDNREEETRGEEEAAMIVMIALPKDHLRGIAMTTEVMIVDGTTITTIIVEEVDVVDAVVVEDEEVEDVEEEGAEIALIDEIAIMINNGEEMIDGRDDQKTTLPRLI